MLFLLGAHSSNIYTDDARCVGEFRTTFRTIPAFVAQWIEQRFPTPQVAGPIPAEGAHRGFLTSRLEVGFC